MVTKAAVVGRAEVPSACKSYAKTAAPLPAGCEGRRFHSRLDSAACSLPSRNSWIQETRCTRGSFRRGYIQVDARSKAAIGDEESIVPPVL